MKDLKYPAKIHLVEGSLLVEFSDLPGCFTEGDNLEHAKEMAKEVLDLFLDTLKDDGKELPKPSKLKGDDIYYIQGELGTSTTYTEYHKKSYDKNKTKILQTKKEKEQALKSAGYKNFREFLHADTLKKLDKIATRKNLNRRALLTKLIESEFEKV